MKSCITCGMPLEGEHAGDVGFESADGWVCRFDSENGVIKSAEVIFEGGVAFFTSSLAHGDAELAKRLTRANMRSLPYWQTHPFELLNGEVATAEEFNAAMAQL